MEIEEISNRLMKLKACIVDLNMNPNYSFKLEKTINELFPECFEEETQDD